MLTYYILQEEFTKFQFIIIFIVIEEQGRFFCYFVMNLSFARVFVV